MKGSRYDVPLFPCTDIRGGMAAVLYALANSKKVTVQNHEILERGYENLDTFFGSFGYRVSRSHNGIRGIGRGL